MMTPRTVTTEFFFDGDTLHENVAITIDDARISNVSPSAHQHDHFLVSPGLVDLQLNGYDDIDVADSSPDALTELVAQLRSRGTFSFLATLVSAPLPTMLDRANQLARYMRDNQSNGIIGIHLEGPFLGGAHGAHSSNDIVDADIDWISLLPPEVRMMTVAPDNPTSAHAIRALVKQGTVVSLGHSTPTQDQFTDAIVNGATSVTHLFNAMSGVHHRADGMALWALIDDRVTKGIIADGVHVSESTGDLIGRVVPPSARYLVSDSIAWNDSWARRHGVERVDGAPRLADGTLAGSSATLAECMAHAVSQWKWPLLDAIQCCTVVPSHLIGEPPPRLTVGSNADAVCWSSNLGIDRVLSGRSSDSL